MSTPIAERLSDLVTLYEGDCMDVLPTLAGVDAVVTDPPYGNNYSTGWRAGIVRSSTTILGDKLSEPILNGVAAKLDPVLNDVAAVYWFAAPDRLDMVLPIIKRHWSVVNVLCWDKGNCTAGDLDCSYGKQWEAIVYARKNRVALVGSRDRDILRFGRGNTIEYLHPTQKPVSLFRYLIRRHAAEVILDPFAGSGTTGVAATLEGRQCILIERDPAYCEVIRKRIAEANGVGPGSLFTSVQPDMFTDEGGGK